MIFGVRPVKLMEPVADAQFVGSVLLLPEINGAEFIVTKVFPRAEEQFPIVAVIINL